MRRLSKGPPETHSHLEDPASSQLKRDNMNVHASINSNILTSKGFIFGKAVFAFDVKKSLGIRGNFHQTNWLSV